MYSCIAYGYNLRLQPPTFQNLHSSTNSAAPPLVHKRIIIIQIPDPKQGPRIMPRSPKGTVMTEPARVSEAKIGTQHTLWARFRLLHYILRMYLANSNLGDRVLDVSYEHMHTFNDRKIKSYALRYCPCTILVHVRAT